MQFPAGGSTNEYEVRFTIRGRGVLLMVLKILSKMVRDCYMRKTSIYIADAESLPKPKGERVEVMYQGRNGGVSDLEYRPIRPIGQEVDFAPVDWRSMLQRGSRRGDRTN